MSFSQSSMACSSLSLASTSISKCCIKLHLYLYHCEQQTHKILSFRKKRKGDKLEKGKVNKIISNEAFENEDKISEEEKKKIVKDEGSEKEGQAFETDEQQSGTSGYEMHEKL